MTPPTSKLPFLNCITDVLLMHVPSGKIKIGGFLGSDTCCRSLKRLKRSKISKQNIWNNHEGHLAATADLSLASFRSNQI